MFRLTRQRSCSATTPTGYPAIGLGDIGADDNTHSNSVARDNDVVDLLSDYSKQKVIINLDTLLTYLNCTVIGIKH